MLGQGAVVIRSESQVAHLSSATATVVPHGRLLLRAQTADLATSVMCKCASLWWNGEGCVVAVRALAASQRRAAHPAAVEPALLADTHARDIQHTLAGQMQRAA